MALVRLHGQKILAGVILLIAVGWHACWVTRGWNIPGMSGHEFRQVQTAVTVHAMKAEGFRLDYSTPILGKPWSIPFEFPLYQYVVARISTVGHLGEVDAGRWVSLSAFYLALPALFLLLRTAAFSPVAAALGTVPVLGAPVFLLYSRAVLIESTAFLASSWFLYWLTQYRLHRRAGQFTVMLLCGITAVLVKSTTWAVFCLPWAVWVLRDGWQARSQGWRAFRVIAEDVLLIGLPLLAVGFGWVWITDQIKTMNPIAGFLTSANLASFNFGTLAERLDPRTWRVLWSHWTMAVMPGWCFVAGAVALVAVPRKGRIVFFLAATAFVLGQFIFINLYALHDYYFYANAAGACLAFGGVVGGLWDLEAPWYRSRLPSVLLLVAVAGGEFSTYQKHFYRIQMMDNSGSSPLAEAIRQLVGHDEVIVMHAGDWSALLAYRSDRRMLIIPDSQMFFRPDAVRRSIALLDDEQIPLVIFRGESRDHLAWVRERVMDFDLEPIPLCTAGDMTCYASRNRYRAMRAFLESARIEGIDLAGGRSAATYPVTIPLAGTPAAVGLKMFSPVPTVGSFPYGLKYYNTDGRTMLFAHSPTTLDFSIPPGASRVEFSYRMAPNTYGQPSFDGVVVTVEVVDGITPPVRIYRGWVAPDGNRNPRVLNLPLGRHTHGTLVVSCLPGPTGNTACDWALFDYLRIR